MKQAILIVAIVLSSIVFPVMAEANDTTEVNITNSILKKEEVNLPWYKALNYEIGYTGGICYTGKDLAPYTSDFQIKLPLYWLNLVEVSATYPLKDGKGVEVGLGYGWANPIEFRLIPVWVGYSKKKIDFKNSVCLFLFPRLLL